MTKIPLPFRYPKSKHKRKLNPPQYKTNKSYKSVLREEFNKQCIYCRKPEFFNVENFGVEHYKPKKIFPELKWEYDNLFYACNCCNSRKGEFWPTEKQLRDKVFVPNPCDHIMFEHLKFDGAKIEMRSEAGKYTGELLSFNEDKIVEWREVLISIVEQTIRTLKETGKNISKLEKKLRDELSDNERIEINEDIANLNNEKLKLKSRLIECGVSL